ncbi:glycosyltransferase [Fodinicurvata sp. EGI_FJ10296]|uniref:CgeB family protein n=1 Tax=Fodinicurvata sp. EGI_FJ10296 TaxID=3231908 RepID=UPI0034550850
MKLVFFGLSLSSSWGNGHATTYRSLLRALADRGHDIVFYERDVPWYRAHRDLPDPDFCTLRLYDRLPDIVEIDDEAPDAVIIGSYVEDAEALVAMLSNRTSVTLAYYDIDTPVTVAGLAAGGAAYLKPRTVPAFDVYLSFSGGPIMTRLKREFGARMVRSLSCSVDTRIYAPIEVPRRYALGYLGTYDPSRQPALEELLIEPARRMPDRRFIVAGALYPDDIAWPGNVERIAHLPPSEHAAFYASLVFALNVTRADMVKAGYSPSVRIFEAAGCARPVITDVWPGLAQVLEPGAEVLCAGSADDVVACLAMADASRERIARAGYLRVLRDHTATARAVAFEDALIEAAHGRMARTGSQARARAS